MRQKKTEITNPYLIKISSLSFFLLPPSFVFSISFFPKYVFGNLFSSIISNGVCQGYKFPLLDQLSSENTSNPIHVILPDYCLSPYSSLFVVVCTENVGSVIHFYVMFHRPFNSGSERKGKIKEFLNTNMKQSSCLNFLQFHFFVKA